MRRLNDFAEKRVNSVDTRSPVVESSETTYRCSSPGAEEDSVCAEITFHSARETVATSVKRIVALTCIFRRQSEKCTRRAATSLSSWVAQLFPLSGPFWPRCNWSDTFKKCKLLCRERAARLPAERT